MSIEVPTVAFAYLSPDALRVFLTLKGYRVNVFTGDKDALDLRRDKPSTNVVILPNFAKRAELVPIIDQVGTLLVLTNGKHEDVIAHSIPILDADIDDQGELHCAKPRSPHYYMKKISEASVALQIDDSLPSPDPIKKTTADHRTSLDSWFSLLDDVVGTETNFDYDVEFPTCQFLIGELGKADFQNAMKKLVTDGADKATVRDFYKWLTATYADPVSAAIRAYLWPKTAEDELTAAAVAKAHRVHVHDIELLEGIYTSMRNMTSKEREVDDE